MSQSVVALQARAHHTNLSLLTRPEKVPCRVKGEWEEEEE
jgi:hypothetical protein